MTRYHRTTATLNLAREMAKKALEIQKHLIGKTVDPECRHEIDNLAQMSQYMLLTTEERDESKKEEIFSTDDGSELDPKFLGELRKGRVRTAIAEDEENIG